MTLCSIILSYKILYPDGHKMFAVETLNRATYSIRKKEYAHPTEGKQYTYWKVERLKPFECSSKKLPLR